MKISQREMILGVATLAAVLSGTTWYIVDSKVGEWRAKANTIEKAEQQIRHYQAAIKMQENWQDELNALQDGLRVFDAGKSSVSPDLMRFISSRNALS